MSTSNATAHLPAITVVVQAGPTGRPAYFAMWRHRRTDGTVKLTKRKIGAAWLDANGAGGWTKRKGRVGPDHFNEQTASVAAAELVRRVESELAAEAVGASAFDAESRTFRGVAAAFLRHREDVKGTRPSTLRDYRRMLAEPGTPHRRGFQREADGSYKLDTKGQRIRTVTDGWIMRRLGDTPADEVSTRDIERVLADVTAAGRGPTTVNKYRALLSSIFAYAGRESTYGLVRNPVKDADRRRQPPPADIEFYSVEEIEALARALHDGKHRGKQWAGLSAEEVDHRRREDHQDAELARIAAYTGLRRSEIVALKWRDVDFTTRQVHVRRTISAGVEVDAPKSGKRRAVPMTDRALAAFDRLSQRTDFTGRDDNVAVNAIGRRIDGDAFGRRVADAQDAAGLRRLALHGLRHSFASQLVAAGLGLADVQKALGHSKIETTGRYLHARPATELAKAFSRAQAGAAIAGTSPAPNRGVTGLRRRRRRRSGSAADWG